MLDVHAHTAAHAGRRETWWWWCLVSVLLRNVFSGLLETSQSVIVDQVLK